jgi:hypothetical protein
MINFDEEVAKFKPSLEVEQAEDVISNNDLTDMTDLIKVLINDNKSKNK